MYKLAQFWPQIWPQNLKRRARSEKQRARYATNADKIAARRATEEAAKAEIAAALKSGDSTRKRRSKLI